MVDPSQHPDESLEPDISHLITEDDTPVDNIYSEKQMRLLVGTLYSSWKPGRDFVAMSNVGLFAKAENPAVVPDVMVSLDVTLPKDMTDKGNRSYMIWRYGKPPDLVIEVVANADGVELDKLETYARMAVPYYVIHDPEHWLGDRVLRAYERQGTRYMELPDCSWVEQLGVGLTLWEGSYEGWHDVWLRWCDREGNLLPTGYEMSAAARADAEQQRAESALARADAARAETDRLQARLNARLRELGLDEEAPPAEGGGR